MIFTVSSGWGLDDQGYISKGFQDLATLSAKGLGPTNELCNRRNGNQGPFSFLPRAPPLFDEKIPRLDRQVQIIHSLATMSSSTTVLPILYCQFRGYTTLMSASVLSVDTEPDLTTVVLHCAVPESAAEFPQCTTLGIPFTITAGPSTMEYDYTAAVIIPGTSTFYRHGTVDCGIGSGETFRCDETTSDFFGEVPTYTNRTWTTSRTITDRTWLGLTITGGLDKLPDPAGVITTTATDEEGDPATVTITLTSTETVTNASPSETTPDTVSQPGQKSSVTPNAPTWRLEIKRRSTSSRQEVSQKWRHAKLRWPS
jgi:hypothetical protein